METSLHRSLKSFYATPGARTEAAVSGFRADVLRDDVIVEIQASPFSAISGKIAALVEQHRVLVVKPIARRKVLLRRSSAAADWDIRRLSPKHGRLIHVFEDLVYFTRVFPHPNLCVDAVLVDEEELRERRRARRFRRADYRTIDRRLTAVVSSHRLQTAADLLALLPPGLPRPFTTDVLARHVDAPEWLARKIAYTLRHCGATRATGKRGNRIVYEPVTPARDEGWMVAC
jgi:hypothetical protein